MDYRDFLGRTTTAVLPYLGGTSVSAPDRRLRVTTRVAVGWWRFSVSGRHATPEEPAEAPPLDELPAVRGHLVGDWLFSSGTEVCRLWLMPEERPAVLSPAVGRRWPSGAHLFDTIDFDDEVVEAARTALHDDARISGLKGASPALRAAFGFAAVARLAATRHLHVSPLELVGHCHEVAEGTLEPHHFLTELEARRFQTRPDHYVRPTPRRPPTIATIDGAPDRAAAVLDAAGASLLDTRPLGGRSLEVTFRFMDERFVAIVDWQTLHVYDSGICLSGHDEELGLDSLPSVIAEAIATGQLHITNR